MVTVFVLLIGAIGYMGILRSSSQLAKQDAPLDVSVNEENTTPPVDSTQDLDEALKTIDEISIDEQLIELDTLDDF